MKVYIDLIMLLNFAFDFILLLSVSILLRRKVSIYKILLGAFIGGISILFLFMKLNNITLFLFKIIVSIVMVIITFSYRDIKYTFKNLIFLYSASIILGGFLYFINIQFSYKNNGLVFFNNGLSINAVFLIIFCPVIIYIYIKQGLWLKNNYSNYYDVYILKYKLKLVGFMDTGNNLMTKSNKPVILINKKISMDSFFYLPCLSVGGNKLLKCFYSDVIINDNYYKKVAVGLIENKIQIDGVDCLLNKNL